MPIRKRPNGGGLGFLADAAKWHFEQKAKHFKEPVRPVDLEKVSTIADLVDAFAGMSVQARRVGDCANVLARMLEDPERPTIFLGLAGPLIAGGLRKTIRDMVEYGLVDVIVSTGAILYQDLYQAKGYRHYKGTPDADDAELRLLQIDRIYDTYVDEEMFWDTDMWIGHFADELPPGKYSSRHFLAAVSETIRDDPGSILATALRRGVPIFSPALNDSSIGIGLTEHHYRHRRGGTPMVTIDAIADNYELTQVVVQSPKTAAIYVAGGVPKNFINDSVVMSYIWGRSEPGHAYAIQLTTDVPHWGGLSGSTLREATSWGKIKTTGNIAMAFVEPTVSLPLVVGHALQRGLYKRRPRILLEWEEGELRNLSYEK